MLFTDGMPGHYKEAGKAKNNDEQRFNCMSANKACNYAEKIKAKNDGNAILYTVGYFKTGRDSEESQIYWHKGDSDSSYDRRLIQQPMGGVVVTITVSYTHLRAHETGRNLVCRLLLEKKKKKNTSH